MTAEKKRATLAAPVEIEGIGLHSGAPVAVRLEPGEEGIAFHLAGARIPAHISQASPGFQRTQVGPVHTPEHLLAALAMTGVTDVEIHLTAPEVPGVDGSALPFVAATRSVGLSPLPSVEVHRLFSRVYHIEGAVKVAISAGEGRMKFRFDTGSRWPGVQEAECLLSDVASVCQDIAPARTLAFEEDLEKAQAPGLGRGLTAESCLVLGQSGYINEARFPDEPARHKLLDLIGDLSLAGYPLTLLNVVAERSGHKTHLEAAAKLAEALTVG